MPLYFKRKAASSSYGRFRRMGLSKARPYYRARRTFGRRIGAAASNASRVSRLSNAGHDGLTLTSTQAIIPRPLSSGSKFVTDVYGAAIASNGTGTTGITTQIAAGTGEEDRLGNEITLNYIDIVYTIANNNTAVGSQLNAWNTTRFMLVLDRATNGTVPGLAGYKADTSGAEAVRSPWDQAYVPGALVPLVDLIHDYDSEHRIVTVRKRVNLRGIKTTYNSSSAGSAYAVSNHLFFLFISDYSNNSTLYNQLGCRLVTTLCFSE